MDRARELELLVRRRAELVQRMSGKLDSIEVTLRLTCLDDEIRKKKAEQNPSVLAKTRSAIGRLFLAS